MNIFEKQHAVLVTEFDRYVYEHPEFAVHIPNNALVVLQLNNEDEYNEWSQQLAQKQREKKQSVIRVIIKGLKPAHSRLIKPVLIAA